jgi:PAP2 superfamily
MTNNEDGHLPLGNSVPKDSGPVDTVPATRTNLRSGTTAFDLTLAALLIGVVLALSASSDFYASTIISPYLSLALFSALIVLVMVRRAWTDLLWVSAATVLLYILDYRILHFKPAVMAGFSFAGLAAFAVLGVRTIWARGEQRVLLIYSLVPVTLFVGSEWMATTLLDVTERLHPKTFDLFLYSFDSSLRVQISFLVGQLFWKLQWLRTICLLYYIALPLALALVYAGQLRKSRPKAVLVMIAFLITGPVGVLFYNMLPACGPVHLFGGAFPNHPLSAAEIARMPLSTLPVRGARNAIPSLHMAWVLLIWWNSKGLSRWIRAIALSFVWATVLATLGTGEHYFIDLIVAFPFSLMIQAISSHSLPIRSGPRRSAFLFGTFCTLAWIGLLSFETKLFWLSPVLPWIMISATVSLSVLLWHELTKVFVSEQPSEASQEVARLMVRAHGAS